MRVLVVGAGALGQVFGAWLAAGGAQVGYLVKPGREKWGEGGVPVYRLGRGGAVEQRLVPHEVLTRPVPGKWDMVWLCVDSTALSGRWMADLRDATGSATVVTITQSGQDVAILAEVWPREQIVQVTPAVFAYQAPLAVEVPRPGIAYWVPPGATLGVHGGEARVREVVAALRAGGVRAKAERLAGGGDLDAARMMPFIAALENATWSIRATRYALAAGASREALAITAARYGRRPPSGVPAWLARAALRVLPRVVPFDLPAYLRTHFTKVSAQTGLMLEEWIEEGTARGLPVTDLKALSAGRS
ncbi:ketopantoate reductase family protein [Spongiactinospora rosea]|nr:2-dehydropantoate 2-reductase N-terminal domain-containing protein [Spongiactinospora rosea]